MEANLINCLILGGASLVVLALCALGIFTCDKFIKPKKGQNLFALLMAVIALPALLLFCLCLLTGLGHLICKLIAKFWYIFVILVIAFLGLGSTASSRTSKAPQKQDKWLMDGVEYNSQAEAENACRQKHPDRPYSHHIVKK